MTKNLGIVRKLCTIQLCTTTLLNLKLITKVVSMGIFSKYDEFVRYDSYQYKIISVRHRALRPLLRTSEHGSVRVNEMILT